MSRESRRVLVVGPAWVGDMVMSQVIYSALRQSDPDVHIDVLAPRATLSLVSRMAEVNRGILINQGHGQLGLGYRHALGRKLAEERYDQAIITPNSLKSALVPCFAGIPRRTGFLGEYRYFLLNDIKFLNKKQLPLMTDRFMALVDRTGGELIQPRLMTDADTQEEVCEKLGLDSQAEIVGFCPGAEFGDAKKWPEAHFAALGRELVADGRQVWIFGSPADQSTGEKIKAAIGDGCSNLAGQTTLPEAIDLLSLCGHIVSNDSGLMHIAAAVGVPVTAVYGSTSPGFTPPLSDKANIVSLNLDCSPCFKRVCPLGHKDCLNRLTPDKVRAHV
ncbi:MAG: lipopolysaccharide heptosyltransferase II [Pseudomonadales bacterium]